MSLRRDFPPTFRGIHGNITYTLTVTIYRPWRLSKSFVTELLLMSRMNLSQPELWVCDPWLFEREWMGFWPPDTQCPHMRKMFWSQENIVCIATVIPTFYCNTFLSTMFHFACSVLYRGPTPRLCSACGVPLDPSPWLPLHRKKPLPQVFFPSILPFTHLQVCLTKKKSPCLFFL